MKSLSQLSHNEAYSLGLVADLNTKNPYLKTSNNWDAFELGRFCGVSKMGRRAIKKGRGDSWWLSGHKVKIAYDGPQNGQGYPIIQIS